MRVIQIIESIDPRSGGTSSAFLEIVDALDADPECEVRAFTHAPDPEAALEHAGARDKYELTGPAGQLRKGDLAVRAIQAIDRGECDIVHLHGMWNADLVRIARAAQARRVPTIWQPHGMLVERALGEKRLKKRLFMLAGLRRGLLHASAMVYCTAGEHRMSAASGRWANGRHQTIPLPVCCPITPEQIGPLRISARERFGIDQGAPVLVFMGRLHPVKRIELSLEALAFARKAMPDLRLAIFGSGEDQYERFLRDEASRMGVEHAVTWGGWVARDDRWAALAAGDGLTINSRFENFGYVIPEALMVGTGVVATDNLSMAADLQADGIGHVVRPEPGVLGEAYLGLVSQTQEQRERARRWADERFSPAKVGAQLISLYRTLLAEGASPA